MKTILSVASARPNFVKLAAVHHAIAAHPKDFTHVIVHTGQHYDPLLSDVFFEQLQIPAPAHNLGIHGGTRQEVIDQTEAALAKILPTINPDVVLVYGDVNGAVGAARAAKAGGYKLGHVEAGLRSFDDSMPEEHNRKEIDQLGDILFCSEQSGVDHLKTEQVKGEVQLVGNTMIDTLIRMMPTINSMPLPFEHAGPDYVIATLHRPSNVDDLAILERVMHFLNEVAKYSPIILPAHPRLRTLLEQSGKILPGGNLLVIEPLGYLEFIRQMRDAKCILTDSGGIQEEATFLQKRCFTLRRNTERPSTIESGSNVLIDPEKESDRSTVLAYAENPSKIDVTIPPLWDGKAGERIIEVLRK